VATTPQPMPDQGSSASAAPQGGGGGTPPPDQAQPAPSQAPANQMQLLLAKWYQAAKQMAASDPRLASGAQKVAEGINEMQTALVTPPQPTPQSQQPQ
jgi:hypothetical protein